MEHAAYRMLYDSIHAFKTTAVHVESEIRHLGIDGNKGFEAVPGMGGRTHHEMWMSMKAVSHFNLGTALELMLKMILLRNKKPLSEMLREIDPKERHYLTVLYEHIPEEEKKKLDSKFDEIFKEKSMRWVAVLIQRKTATKPDDPFGSKKNRPKRTNGSSLINFFTDFDKEARLWQKRDAWEDVEKKKWLQYLDNISVFVELINRVMAGIERP